MAQKELPITLEEQIDMMKKYVSFRQRIRMRRFLLHAGYFRASRYGKFLLSNVENVGYKSSQDALFALYQFDVDLRRILIYYCNRVEVRFKSAISNACAIKAQDGTFYMKKEYYAPSRGERDTKKRKTNIKYFESVFYDDIVRKEEKLRKNVVKYPELKEYRKGGNRHTNKLPIWVTFSYTEFGTMSMMYNYLRGDLRKGVLTYLFHEKRYSKGDTELVDTWLDGVRNLRNYCAHNSMVVGLKSYVSNCSVLHVHSYPIPVYFLSLHCWNPPIQTSPYRIASLTDSCQRKPCVVCPAPAAPSSTPAQLLQRQKGPAQQGSGLQTVFRRLRSSSPPPAAMKTALPSSLRSFPYRSVPFSPYLRSVRP